MNLASNTAPPGSTRPSSVAAIHLMTGCWIFRCTCLMARPVLRSYQRRLRSSVTDPSCTIRLSERSSGSTSPRFSRHSRTRTASSSPMMIRASEPPIKARRSDQAAMAFGRGIACSDMSALHNGRVGSSPSPRDVICYDNYSIATELISLITDELSTHIESRTLQMDAIFVSNTRRAGALGLEPSQARPHRRRWVGDTSADRTK